MTRSSIKAAIRSHCSKLDELPKDLQPESSSANEVDAYGDPRGEWPQQRDCIQLFQDGIAEPFVGQIVDVGHDDDIILYAARERGVGVTVVEITHVGWDKLRAIQFCIERSVTKHAIIDEPE
jgi:hypothetical protein